jgi:uncharacterized protein (UPF0261 family)
VPTRGFSVPGAPGGPLHEPETDREFVEELKKQLHPEIQLIEMDTHLNTAEFAGAVVQAFREVFALRAGRVLPA